VVADGRIHSVAASVTRAVLAFWMVFFSAFDAVAGIATGVLTRHANSLAGSEKDGVVAAINFPWDDSRLAKGGFSVLGIIGQGSWIVLAIAATVALYRAVSVGSSSAPPWCRCSSLVTRAPLPQSA
jgi:hypothetical protein